LIEQTPPSFIGEFLKTLHACYLEISVSVWHFDRTFYKADVVTAFWSKYLWRNYCPLLLWILYQEVVHLSCNRLHIAFPKDEECGEDKCFYVKNNL